MGYASLNALADEIRNINRANGWRVFVQDDWHADYKFPAVVALIHSEVSESLEAFRAGDRENALEELADIVIRVLDVAGGLTDDFDSVVADKLAVNQQRGYRHGGKRV